MKTDLELIRTSLSAVIENNKKSILPETIKELIKIRNTVELMMELPSQSAYSEEQMKECWNNAIGFETKNINLPENIGITPITKPNNP